MDKLKLHTPDITAENIAKLAELFPNCVTESLSKDGTLKQSVDFDQLRQELSNTVVEGPQERYQLNWPGKREALLTANAPISKTLRPCREESVDFDTTKNLYIEGDNLDALKLLQETYLNKVKMIYIDPPYNTGNDFIYEDDFKMESKSYLLKSDQLDEEGDRLVTNSESNGRFHSDWLTMMYSRLRLSRNLLADDGVIFISIDENEVVNMKKICDEIFGEDNFIENFIWKKSYGGGPKERYAVTQHEYILLYTKVISNLDNFSLRYDPAKITRYYKHKDQHHELRGPYRLKPLEATKSMDSRPNLVYGIPAPDGHEIQPKRQWLWSKARVIKALENGELEFIGSGEKQTVNYKQYLKDENGIERGEKPFSIIDGIYTQKGTDDIRKIFDDKVLIQFPKPVDLISKLVEIGCGNKRDSIVLDFFSGSATSAHAVMALNADDGGERRHIMVQLPETCGAKSEAFKAGYATIAEIGRERIRRSGKKIKAENINKPSVQSLDIGFRVFKIDSSNMKDIYYAPDEVSQDDLFSQASNIREDRTPEDLLFQVLLDWGVDLALPISQETIAGKTV
ncbi:site-specific DNA-methyltransferase, partial [uncultured Amphritea sp.]|uniref:site-specific DNA-methyltransferase n=1 Tax=uncultured Amphritea sp. TaxID=981605 RepID=UPI002635C7B6